jgi:DNA-binding protein H-NS
MAKAQRDRRTKLTANQIAESVSSFTGTELLKVLDAIMERLVEFKEHHKAKAEQYDALIARLDSRPPRNARGLRKGRRFQPKYRNPKDPSQTWSGQGRTPKWMPGSPKELSENILKRLRIND